MVNARANLRGTIQEISIEIQYADEDIGHNCGTVSFKNGQSLDWYYPEGEEAIEFACNITGYDYEEYKADIEDTKEY
jgi:hypothetical protein